MLSNIFAKLRHTSKTGASILRHSPIRWQLTRFNSSEQMQKKRIKSTLYYVSAAGVLVAGFSYAAVPLYRMFCQSFSYGGTTSSQHDPSNVENMTKREGRILKIKFNADIGASMRWNFKPQQYEIKVFISQISNINIIIIQKIF